MTPMPKDVLEKFEKDYITKKIRKYIGEIGLTAVHIAECEISCQRLTAKNLDAMKQVLQKKGGDPDTWCITARFKKSAKELPEGLSLPETFMGLKVYLLPNIDRQMRARPAYPERVNRNKRQR